MRLQPSLSRDVFPLAHASGKLMQMLANENFPLPSVHRLRQAIPEGINTRQPINAGITSVDRCYTTRALYAMAYLWRTCESWSDPDIRSKLLFTLTSLYQRGHCLQ